MREQQRVVLLGAGERADVDESRVRLDVFLEVVERGEAVLDPLVRHAAADEQDRSTSPSSQILRARAGSAARAARQVEHERQDVRTSP